MKRNILLITIIGLVLVGCSQDSTKKEVYNDSWDGITILVEQIDNNEDYHTINEITDADQVTKLIETLKKADWKDNVDIDMKPADYHFTWNSFKHQVWVNEESGRLSLSIDGRSSYVNLSESASKTVFKILTSNEN